jgi:hypothetical protein
MARGSSHGPQAAQARASEPRGQQQRGPAQAAEHGGGNNASAGERREEHNG